MNNSSDFGYGKLLEKLQKQEKSGELYRELVEPSREVYFSGPLKPPFAKDEFARRQPELQAWAAFWRRRLRREATAWNRFGRLRRKPSAIWGGRAFRVG